MDWNLLSTASPAINAWMNPSNRLAIRVVHMLRCRYRRNTAVITCLMAEALDVQGLHMPIKVRQTLWVTFEPYNLSNGLILRVESIWSNYSVGENITRRSIVPAVQYIAKVYVAESQYRRIPEGRCTTFVHFETGNWS